MSAKVGSPILQLRSISKRFNGVCALKSVDFELAGGEIHALLGENGAGKSTLVKVLTGAHTLDAGHMTLHGKSILPRSPSDAMALGISTVYQEVNLLPNLSVAHNLYLGREPKRFGCIDWKRIEHDAALLLQRFRLDIDVRQSLASFSVAIQQLVAIARAIDCSASVLILDEPTASLDAGEAALLFDILRELKAQGIAIVFITHFLDQVYALSDRITVLRNGEKVGSWQTAQLPRSELVAHMLGRPLQAQAHDSGTTLVDNAARFLEVTSLSADNGIHGISFAASRGETVGLAGLLGAGRTELCETLFGLAAKTAGEIRLEGKPCEIDQPGQAMALGLALCPEDRKSEGIIGPLSIRENIALALQAQRGWWRPLPRREQDALAAAAIRDLGIACPDADIAIANLSGGNQQKVILARWLATRPAILILDEPTRGIDIGAHAEIVKLIRQLCEQGMTVIVASSELEELVAFSDKIVVLRDRTVAAELNGAAITEPAIMAAIAASHAAANAGAA